MTESTLAAGSAAAELARRRTFAIISHPDAGKTTLTEKLLLYGGAIHLAGSVKARRAARHATSDWMKMEQERGISVTSSVMQFDYDGYCINLLDTPGHEDFSEDTYRTLVAADSAVMLLDNRRGVEERTRQLFAVCKRRRTPIFTFVNKCDRVGEDPLRLIGDVEVDLGINCHAATWPVYREGVFAGIFSRSTRQVHIFDRTADHGATRATHRTVDINDPELLAITGEAGLETLLHEIELLNEAGHEFNAEAVLSGELTPVFFGSALSNFGVEPFFREFLRAAPPPLPRSSSKGEVLPDDDEFTGFVFKIQANMDPRHRDRLALIRICSGHFEAGMQAKHVRTGRMIRMNAPQQMMARERVAVEEGWAGDVIGMIDRGTLRIGDTLTERSDLEFTGIPRFAPEHFARVVLRDHMRRKQLDAGLRQLTEEGAAQVFFTSPSEVAGPNPILGAVGMLQFDVMIHRLEHEYGVKCALEALGYRHPRWVVGSEDDIDSLSAERGCMRLYDVKGHPVLLFDNEWSLKWSQKRGPNVAFLEEAP
jgi:peptide chain release factor 3